MALELEPPSAIQAPPKDSFSAGLRHRATTITTFLALLWLVFLVNTLLFHGSLIQHGVIPRSLHGLLGILFAPFLHVSWSHLTSNSLGILLLGGLLILRDEEAFWAVSILGALASGIGTWLIGRGDSIHVGASGIIFAYFGYLLSAGIFERRIVSLLISIAVFFLWGGMLWSTTPFTTSGTISWEGHLSGLLAGLLTARLLATAKWGNQKPGNLDGPAL